MDGSNIINMLEQDHQNKYCLGKEFFYKHQRILLWLLNAPIVKYWFRWVMRIRKYDCPYNTKINLIEPNNFVFNAKRKGKKIELTRDFRTHNKYSKRLYYAFYPLWVLCHAWDILIANQFKPAWNLGFDTLTVYPAAGNNTPADGWQSYKNANWTTCRDATSGDYNSKGADDGQLRLRADYIDDYTIARAHTLFDTSSLGSSADISSATLSLFAYGTTSYNTDSSSWIIVESSCASTNNFVLADYSAIGSVSFGSKTFATLNNTADAENSINLNSSGINNINKTGISKFAHRVNRDLDNLTPTGRNSWEIRSADAKGTSSDPKLVVTYTVPVKDNSIFFSCNF